MPTTYQRRRIAWLLLGVFLLGGLLAPVLHRVQHAAIWEALHDTWTERLAEICPHGGHEGGFLLGDEAYDPPPCTLCAGVVLRGVLAAPVAAKASAASVWTMPEVPRPPRISTPHVFIRGPPVWG